MAIEIRHAWCDGDENELLIVAKRKKIIRNMRLFAVRSLYVALCNYSWTGLTACLLLIAIGDSS